MKIIIIVRCAGKSANVYSNSEQPEVGVSNLSIDYQHYSRITFRDISVIHVNRLDLILYKKTKCEVHCISFQADFTMTSLRSPKLSNRLFFCFRLLSIKLMKINLEQSEQSC